MLCPTNGTESAAFVTNVTNSWIQLWIGLVGVKVRAAHNDLLLATSYADVGNASLVRVHFDSWTTNVSVCTCSESYCDVWKLPDGVSLTHGRTYGTLYQPVSVCNHCIQKGVYRNATSVSQSIELHQDWTWFSFNVVPDRVPDVLTHETEIVLGGDHRMSHIWSDSMHGWSSMVGYKSWLVRPRSVEVSGVKILRSGTHISKGWNWISTQSLDRVPVPQLGLEERCDVLKDEDQFTSYNTGFGWFGPLSICMPGKMLKVRCAHEFQLHIDRTSEDGQTWNTP